LLRAEKIVKKARKAKLLPENRAAGLTRTKTELGKELFTLTEQAQRHGWSAEEVLRSELRRREQMLRQAEAAVG
jgi:hypothetical protein